MNKKKIIIIALISVAVLALLFFPAYKLIPGELTVELSPTSTITSGVTFSLSNDNYQHSYTLPQTFNLRSGKYQIFASGSNSNVFKENFKVTPGLTTVIKISLQLNPDLDLTNDDSINNLKQPDYLKLFPHIDKNFEVRAKTKVVNNEVVIELLTIIPYVAAGPDDNAQTLTAKKKNYVDEANKWIKANNIPASIPTTVDSPF